MKGFAMFALALAGCGRWAFDPTVTRDAVGSPDAPPCTSFGPFSAPVIVENVNSFGLGSDEWMPTMSADDLTMYFYSYRASLPGAPDIWRATRPTPTDPFLSPEVIAEVSSTATDFSPRVTTDELRMVFTSERVGASAFDLYEATRSTNAMPFGVPVRVTSTDSLLPVNAMSSEESLWLSADGLRIVFESNRNATADLLEAERPDLGSPFGPVKLVANINDGGAFDTTPALSSDELEIFFASTRAGGAGRFDIWRAVRSSRTEPFGTAQQVPQLSSTGDDYGPSLSRDGTRIYYSYNTDTSGAGDANIYVATRACLSGG